MSNFAILLPARVRVILANLLTYLVLAQTILTFVVAEGVFDMWPDIAQYALLAATWIGAVIVFIRRVTPVEPKERGILPVDTVKGG